MRAVRLSAAVVLAAAALLAGARAGGALARPAPAPRPAAAVAYPHGGDAIPVGESLEVAGQPLQLSVFYTGDAPVRVAGFYADAFRARGLTPVMSAETSLAHVAVFDPVESVQRFVSAVSQAGGRTLVMVGATNPRKQPSLVAGAERASFPVPAGHRGLLGFRSIDAGSRAESAQFVTPLPPRAVATFYRSSLSAEGYSESSDSPGDGMLTFAKRGSAISVAVQSLDKASGAAVFVTRTEGDAR